jgi:Uma2 family endonuclease
MAMAIGLELIEGIVYVWSTPDMPSPVSIDCHGMPFSDLGVWLGYYRSKTPGLLYGGDVTVFLDEFGEPQPDALLGIPVAAGGRTRLVREGGKHYVDGAPELVAEIAASTASIDLNAKLTAYQRNGVGEYLVVLTEDQREVRWMQLLDGRFQPIPPDSDGLLKSRLFPGLWLHPAALLAGDLPTLFAAIDRGCATPEHAAFVSRLNGAAPPSA